MYEELIKSLREEARSWCINCYYRAGDCICAAPDDRKKDCDIASELQAADAIESLEEENRFLKMMQQQMVDKIPMDDIGRMAYAALKRVKA